MKSIRIYELYDLWYQPFWLHCMFLFVIGAILIFVIGIVIWMIYKKKNIKKKLPPWDKALRNLERLKPEHFEGYERRKEFYIELTRILKTYLSIRYSIDLLDKTDYESLKNLQRCIGSSLLLEKLETIISGAVWAKFAPQDIIQQKMTEHLSETILIVKSTKSSHVNT